MTASLRTAPPLWADCIDASLPRGERPLGMAQQDWGAILMGLSLDGRDAHLGCAKRVGNLRTSQQVESPDSGQMRFFRSRQPVVR